MKVVLCAVVSGEDVPEVTVEAMGEELSDISPQEELKVHSNCQAYGGYDLCTLLTLLQ